MKIKYLILATESITIKKVPNVYFLFPLKDYCVGFTKEFTLEQIKIEDAYIYINRLLNYNDIINLKKILTKIPPNIKGVVFEDLGVYECLKDLSLEKILYQTHSCCSIKTINTYLLKMDSVVISPDITKEETIEILNKAQKPLIIYGYGYLPCMYSRRTLNTNYANYYHYPKQKILKLEESVTNYPFLAVENKYGTVLYDNHLYNANTLKDNNNIKYILLNPFQTNLDVLDLINNFLNNQTEASGFLHKKTTYYLD